MYIPLFFLETKCFTYVRVYQDSQIDKMKIEHFKIDTKCVIPVYQ